jgi:hypothetical protein
MRDDDDDEPLECRFAGFFSIALINFAVWSFGLFQVVRGVGWFAYSPPNDFGISMVILFGIGLFQLLYVYPLMLIISYQKKRQFIKGLLFGAFLTAIVNVIGLIIFFVT